MVLKNTQSFFRRSLSVRNLRLALAVLFVLPMLAACGIGGDDSEPERTGKIEWRQGEPPGQVAAAPDAGQDSSAESTDAVQPTQTEASAPTATTAVQPTEETQPGGQLTEAELLEYQPNEVGVVPVLMYHNIVEEYGPSEEGDVLFRTVDEFTSDLQWLYDRDFYAVSFMDYLTNTIEAPAGKHPVVITFDDSRPSQMYYLENDDGTVTIDPTSAVGIMEQFFADNPDFGHTAFFGILPIWCFDFEAPDQTQYCDQKYQWLVDNGYEVGNHTWDHQDLTDVSNEVFQQKIVDTTDYIEARVTQNDGTSRILILPYGNFPAGANSDQQWDWIRNGWTYEGEPFQLMSVVAAGADPAPSPADIDFDIMSIARIGAKDFPSAGEPDLFLDFWFGQFDANPDMLYTSDGNPDTITVPEASVGEVDMDKVAAEGKEVVTY